MVTGFFWCSYFWASYTSYTRSYTRERRGARALMGAPNSRACKEASVAAPRGFLSRPSE
jgi:hypothetical protein